MLVPDLAFQVDSLIRELQEISRRADALFTGHASSQLLRRPDENRWSAIECIEHLNLANRSYLPRLEEAIRTLSAKNLTARGPFRLDWNARLLKFWLEPPSHLRLPTSARFQPIDVPEPATAIATFQSLNQQLEERLAAARGLALDEARISSPFAEKMEYSVYSAFVLIATHNRRHLWQAENALRTI